MGIFSKLFGSSSSLEREILEIHTIFSTEYRHVKVTGRRNNVCFT